MSDTSHLVAPFPLHLRSTMLWISGLWMAVEVLAWQFPASRFNFQQDAEGMAGGSYTFSGGYWVAALFPLYIEPLYLPLVIRQ